MSLDPTNDITQTSISLDPSARRDADRAEVKRLAQEFEAMLMTQMLRAMRQSMLNDEDEKENGFGAGPLTDTADVELGRSLSQSGGLGLTQSLLKSFEEQIATIQARTGQAGQTGQPGQTGPAGLARTVEKAGPSSHAIANDARASVAASVTSAAPISSQYGWREDPLTGAAAFHRGIDIAVAYGRDVKAAAEGTVSFAGVQNGYGQTIVVDHAGGRQTRYAHLSQEFVHAGDVVTEGQVLGKTGNSGRSTGPHLHFEMLVNGRSVDPSAAAE